MGDDGRTPGPGWRKCTAYRQTGPGGLPLALRLSEGLGSTARIGRRRRACQGPVTSRGPALKPPAPRCWPWNTAFLSRRTTCLWQSWPCRPGRPDELIEDRRFPRTLEARCGTAAPSLSAGDFLLVLRLRTGRPKNWQRLASIRLWSESICCGGRSIGSVPSRGFAASWLFSSRRQAHFLSEWRTLVLLMPNVRVKTAPAV